MNRGKTADTRVKMFLVASRQEGFPEAVTEHLFAPPRRWRFDIAYPEQKIAIELEGGVWIQGRHSRGKGMEADMEKYNEAQVLGWTVLRYSTGQFEAGIPLLDVKRLLAA